MNNRELKKLVREIMELEIQMAKNKAKARCHPDKDRRAGAKFFYNFGVKVHEELESKLPSGPRVGVFRWKTPAPYPWRELP
tara:strand:+ start:474 stop:716 length:243 start_codon:yes stop_codon:yes gene_type:complete